MCTNSWFNVKFNGTWKDCWALLKTKKQQQLPEVQGLNKRQIWLVRMGFRPLVFQSMHATSEEVKGPTCSPICGEGNSLQLPLVSGWALWEMNGKDVTHWTGNTYSLCIMGDAYHTMQMKVQRIAWTAFPKTGRSENRHVSCAHGSQITSKNEISWDIRSVTATRYLSCDLANCFLFFTCFNKLGSYRHQRHLYPLTVCC